MSGYATKNYMGPGGEEWVIGGKLTILPGAEVSGLVESGLTPAATVDNLENSAVLADVVAAFNELVANLKEAGLMAAAPEEPVAPEENPEEE